MYSAIYRWRLYPGREAEFTLLWEEATRMFTSELGALGSRLHRAEALAQMQTCVAESFPTLVGQVNTDLLAR